MEQYRRRRGGLTGVAGEGLGGDERRDLPVPERHGKGTVDDGIRRGVRVTPGRERRGGVEKRACESNNPCAPDRVVGAASLRAVRLRNGVSSVERVIQTAPARVAALSA